MGSRAFWEQILQNETGGHPMREISARSPRDHYIP